MWKWRMKGKKSRFVLYATSTHPIMHHICPPKFCISTFFNFSWDGCNTQEKRKTKVMQIFFGASKGHYGKFGSGVYYIFFAFVFMTMHDSHSVCLPFFEILPKERSIRSLLYYLNKEAQLLMHFVHGQRITPMIQTLGPFIPGINWESQYLGQVTTRYLLPVSHLRPRLHVETLSGV